MTTVQKPWEHVTPAGPILRPAEAAAYLGISVANYYAQAAAGALPPLSKITGGRATGVPRPFLDAVIGRMLAEAA